MGGCQGLRQETVERGLQAGLGAVRQEVEQAYLGQVFGYYLEAFLAVRDVGKKSFAEIKQGLHVLFGAVLTLSGFFYWLTFHLLEPFGLFLNQYWLNEDKCKVEQLMKERNKRGESLESLLALGL